MREPVEPSTFEEFWPYYVSQHRDAANRRLHFVGTTLAMGCVAIAPLVPPALAAAPVVGYGLAWIGHFAFEKNRPASWHSAKHFAWSFRGDLRMWRLTVTGLMDAEVERIEDVYDLPPLAQAA
ncbi:MAG: DUF962 domain-containing protein [Kofleriaceae bacterium]|nr:DUF962 domain-containing protein [Myxococcales bacterium]MCB9565497.1 DUF962 domain-containing protein [Kofleriaceae bacterium]MCB9570961.1 DUF962 domain-containing protein [Kofleriaceae bacterium]